MALGGLSLCGLNAALKSVGLIRGALLAVGRMNESPASAGSAARIDSNKAVQDATTMLLIAWPSLGWERFRCGCSLSCTDDEGTRPTAIPARHRFEIRAYVRRGSRIWQCHRH